MLKVVWYFTLTSAVWWTAITSYNTQVGIIYPFKVFVLLLMLLIIVQKRKILIKKFSKQTLILFSLILFFAFLSLFWVDDKFFAFSKLSHYVFGILFLFEFFTLNTNIKMVKKSIAIFTLNYILIVGIAIFEMKTGIYFYATHPIQTFHQNFLGNHYPMAVFNNTNDFGTFLFLFFPLGLYGVSLLKRFKRISVLTLFGTVLYLSYNTESRMVSYLIIIYIAILAIYYLINRFNFHSKLILFISSTLILLSLFFTNKIGLLNEFYADIANDSRMSIYKNALSIFLDTFLIGVGIGGIYEHLAFNLHNYILEILFELGIIVFILFVIWFLYLGKKLVKSIHTYDRMNFEKLLLTTFLLNIIFIPFWGGISSSLSSKVFIWILFGFATVIANEMKNKKMNEGVRK